MAVYDGVVATTCLLNLLGYVSLPIEVVMSAVVVYLYSKVVTNGLG